MGKLLPIILLLVGIGGGVGAGIFLRPPPDPDVLAIQMEEKKKEAEAAEEDPQAEREYVKMSNQFVVPVVREDAVASLVVMSLSVEVEPGNRDAIFAREPKLRDSFLDVLFDHAFVGGFDGNFTSVDRLNTLRSALRDVARRDGSEAVTDVLILEIARQDL